MEVATNTRKNILKKYHTSVKGMQKKREASNRWYWKTKIKKYHKIWNPDETLIQKNI